MPRRRIGIERRARLPLDSATMCYNTLRGWHILLFCETYRLNGSVGLSQCSIPVFHRIGSSLASCASFFLEIVSLLSSGNTLPASQLSLSNVQHSKAHYNIVCVAGKVSEKNEIHVPSFIESKFELRQAPHLNRPNLQHLQGQPQSFCYNWVGMTALNICLRYFKNYPC